MESGIDGLELSFNTDCEDVHGAHMTRKPQVFDKAQKCVVTTRELAESLGVSAETVRTAARKLIDPSKSIWRVVNGGRSQVFDAAQATAIKIELQNRSKVAKNGFSSLSISNDLEMLAVQKKLSEYQNMRIAQLTAQLEEQAPKVEAYNRLVDRSGLVNIRETAKELNVKVKDLVAWLMEHKWCFRGKRGEIVATADAVRRKLMVVREYENHGEVFQQPLVTGKGRARLALMIGPAF